MSDTVIKSAKRATSRPAPQSASPRSSAKSSKLNDKPALPKPKPKRSVAEKAPVRKAAPSKTAAPSTTSKSARPVAKQTKNAAPAKPSGGKTPQPAPVAKPKPEVRPQAKKGSAVEVVKARPAKPAPAAKPSTKPAPAAKPTAAAKSTPAPKATPAPPRHSSMDEAAALKAFERAHKEFAKGNFAEARSLFRALIEQHARVSEITARARTYLTIAEARLRTESALPRDPESLYDRGVIELNRGEYVAAQEMFERAIKRSPESADSHYALAATRARLGSIQPALQSLGRAIELKPALRLRAQHDPDFANLRNEPDYEHIVFSNPRP